MFDDERISLVSFLITRLTDPQALAIYTCYHTMTYAHFMYHSVLSSTMNNIVGHLYDYRIKNYQVILFSCSHY